MSEKNIALKKLSNRRKQIWPPVGGVFKQMTNKNNKQKNTKLKSTKGYGWFNRENQIVEVSLENRESYLLCGVFGSGDMYRPKRKPVTISWEVD